MSTEVCDFAGPSFERFKLGFRVDRAFDVRDELGQRADVHTYGFTAGGQRLYERGTTADMRIEHEIARLRERPDGRAREGWGEAGRIL